MTNVQNVAPATIAAPFDVDALFAELESTAGDTFDLVVNAGIAARESLDQGRYVIGDLACHVKKKYGEDQLGIFAADIHCKAASVREYRRVCAFWLRPVRAELFDAMPGLSYSMLRDARRLGDTARALDFLRKCNDEGWKCERASIEIDKLLGKETPEMFKVLDTVLSGAAFSALRLGVDVNPQRKIRLVGYELSEEG
jgi:hypothetical protein